MSDAMTAVNRRALLVAGGMGALAFATYGSAGAAESNAVEKANTQLVKDFCKTWGDDPPDPEKIVSEYLSPDCTVRFGDKILPVTGQADVLDLFLSFFGNGQRYDLKIIDTFARGPVVMNSRIDSMIKGTRVTNPTEVVGVFVIRDGKIKEWSDYV